MISSISSRFFSVAVLIVSISLMGAPSFTYAAEDVADEEGKRGAAAAESPFALFANPLTTAQYIQLCMPEGMSPEQCEERGKIFDTLIKEDKTQELMVSRLRTPEEIEACGNLPDHGAHYPPIKRIQGPFVRYCATISRKRVLEIGGGYGDDVIMALLTENVQVIASDIVKSQLDALKERVNQIYSGNGHFNTWEKNLAQTSVPAKYVGKFHAVNMNKVAHFLDHRETEEMMKNTHLLLAKGGLLFLTVLTPVAGTPEQVALRRNQDAGKQAPGIYYNKILTLPRGEQMVEELTEEDINMTGITPPPLGFTQVLDLDPPLRGRVEVRHYHTLGTLKAYMGSYFDIIDSVNVEVAQGNLRFLSVIARKREAAPAAAVPDSAVAE